MMMFEREQTKQQEAVSLSFFSLTVYLMCVCVQSPAVHGAPGRALLVGRAALQPDERAAEPQRRQDVLAA